MTIVTYSEISDIGKKLKGLYTVSNKDLPRQERIAGRELPRKRTIKLFRQRGTNLYFPVGAFAGNYTSSNKLTEKFTYMDNGTTGEMVEEQDMIMNTIDFEGLSSGLIEMKTGRGKGNLIIKVVEHQQNKTLIAVHNKKTLFELLEKFKKFSNYEPGLYFSGKKQIREITITTHKSLILKNEEFRGKFGTLIVDEADHGLSESMIDAIIFSDVDSIFGLSGTPYRQELSTEDMTLIFGKHLKVLNQRNNGYNMIPDITRIIYENKSVYSFQDFNDIKEQLMNDKVRLGKQLDFLQESHKDKKLGLILVDRIRECETYYNTLKDLGLPVRIVNGETKIKDDEQSIADMIEQHGFIVGTSAKIGRGVDIPQIDSVYLFYPCRFEGNVVQAVGRGLRNFEGKKNITLYDWCDIPILKGQAYNRLIVYRKEYQGCIIEEKILSNELK